MTYRPARGYLPSRKASHHRTLGGTKLYYLVTEAHGCEQSRYTATARPAPAGTRTCSRRVSTYNAFIGCSHSPTLICRRHLWVLGGWAWLTYITPAMIGRPASNNVRLQYGEVSPTFFWCRRHLSATFCRQVSQPVTRPATTTTT